ncbi:DUF6249 domain-containing protein [Parvularcula sp. LCG005]|uniref:DUF6249 domain-containing protein n=1 Tax=Parvularcula sp. LCG005 TaxID=3078805 RepID=UPI0029431754|nr:DUF6249 domain-containing protein [Parvularcula sp. LCG005]WOI52631.1 DUF6249 domain-containing protein [Parvularcula sp. LCG005]
MFDYFGWGSPITIFGFVIIVLIINGIFLTLRTREKHKTMREILRSGQPVDPATLKSLGLCDGQDNGDTRSSQAIAGLILLAVSVGLVVMAYQIQRVEGDEKVLPIMMGVAAIPALISVALLISAFFNRSRKSDAD